MSALVGQLLIAVPNLEDPNFFRSVVLVLHHDTLGASGVVLNRPTDVTVSEAWENSEDARRLDDSTAPIIWQDVNIQVGGPVEGPLILLHQNPDLSEDCVIRGVEMSVRRELVEQIIRHPEQPFRVFAGYSGWGPHQLEAEIKAGGWMVMQAQQQHVFSDAASLWSRVCEEFSSIVVDLPVPPVSNPSLN